VAFNSQLNSSLLAEIHVNKETNKTMKMFSSFYEIKTTVQQCPSTKTQCVLS